MDPVANVAISAYYAMNDILAMVKGLGSERTAQFVIEGTGAI